MECLLCAIMCYIDYPVFINILIGKKKKDTEMMLSKLKLQGPQLHGLLLRVRLGSELHTYFYYFVCVLFHKETSFPQFWNLQAL